MAKTVSYLDTGDAAIELKHRGITIAVEKGGRVRGTLFVTKTGIRWLLKGQRWSRKSRKVVGSLITWQELDDVATGKSTIRP